MAERSTWTHVSMSLEYVVNRNYRQPMSSDVGQAVRCIQMVEYEEFLCCRLPLWNSLSWIIENKCERQRKQSWCFISPSTVAEAAPPFCTLSRHYRPAE